LRKKAGDLNYFQFFTQLIQKSEPKTQLNIETDDLDAFVSELEEFYEEHVQDDEADSEDENNYYYYE
jgi:hypothetical protein